MESLVAEALDSISKDLCISVQGMVASGERTSERVSDQVGLNLSINQSMSLQILILIWGFCLILLCRLLMAMIIANPNLNQPFRSLFQMGIF